MPPVPKKKKRKRLPSLPSLIKKADIAFSRFIRNRDAVELQGRCCTCGGIGNQAGHYIKRSHKKVRWHPKNVHLQCAHCNHFLSGSEAAYSLFIVNKYGVDHLRWLHEQKGEYKVSREELAQIIEAYS